MNAENITRIFEEEWICKFGVPEIVITDQGRQFMYDYYRTLCQKYGIEHQNTTGYHTQCNRKIERFHRMMKNSIKAHSELPSRTITGYAGTTEGRHH